MKNKTLELSEEFMAMLENAPPAHPCSHRYSPEAEEIIRRYYTKKDTRVIAEAVSKIEGRRISANAIGKKARAMRDWG